MTKYHVTIECDEIKEGATENLTFLYHKDTNAYVSVPTPSIVSKVQVAPDEPDTGLVVMSTSEETIFLFKDQVSGTWKKKGQSLGMLWHLWAQSYPHATFYALGEKL